MSEAAYGEMAPRGTQGTDVEPVVSPEASVLQAMLRTWMISWPATGKTLGVLCGLAEHSLSSHASRRNHRFAGRR